MQKDIAGEQEQEPDEEEQPQDAPQAQRFELKPVAQNGE